MQGEVDIVYYSFQQKLSVYVYVSVYGKCIVCAFAFWGYKYFHGLVIDMHLISDHLFIAETLSLHVMHW